VYQNIIQQGGSGGTPTAGQCVNLSGVCVLDAYNSNTMYFRGIDTTDAAILSIALNATNHTIELTINVNALASALPQATTTQKGVGETATDAEAQAKASIVNFVTPSNFAAMGASTTFAGFIEIATDAEAITGTSPTLALTPASFTAAMAANYHTTVTFADVVARSGATPAFVGQFGAQVDTTTAYLGTALTPGAWGPIIVGNAGNDFSNGTTTSVELGSGSTFAFTGDNTSDVVMQGNNLKITNGGILNIDASPIYINNVAAPSSVIINNSFSNADALPIANFASTQNISTGWSGFTNSAVRKTCDCNTVTVAQLAQIVDTLINILITPQLPSV